MNPFIYEKILRHDSVLKYINTGTITPPILAELDITNKCNHYCPNCSGHRKNFAELNEHEIVDIISQLAEYKVKAITFTGGGEPLLSPHILTAIQFAAELGLEIGIITNGSRITPIVAENILRLCTWIRISLDASNADMYRLVHGMNEHEYINVRKNISYVCELKRKTNALCTIGIGYLICPETISGIIDVARDMQISGVDYVQFRPLHYFVLNTQCKKYIEMAQQYATDTYSIICPKVQMHRTYTQCHAAHFIAVIQADMNMPICCHYRGQQQYYIGNLRESTLKEIWQRKSRFIHQLDVNTCIPYCRSDQTNRILHNLIQIEHINFL